MVPVSWRNVKTWNCVMCDMCCKDYKAVLIIGEWVNLVRNYGVTASIPRVSRLLLGTKCDGPCYFLTHSGV